MQYNMYHVLITFYCEEHFSYIATYVYTYVAKIGDKNQKFTS